MKEIDYKIVPDLFPVPCVVTPMAGEKAVVPPVRMIFIPLSWHGSLHQADGIFQCLANIRRKRKNICNKLSRLVGDVQNLPEENDYFISDGEEKSLPV